MKRREVIKMEISQQIKKYRLKANLSQEDLANQIYVTRQTISNWENNKSYPDINSLLLMSEVFEISLDQLIKGDLDKMREEINQQEYVRFHKNSMVLAILFIIILMSLAPLVIFLKLYGLILWVVLWIIGLYYAWQVEKYKKKYDIQTYQEIVAFMDGKNLSDIEKAREEGKRIYQKIFMAGGAGIVGFIVTYLMMGILG